MPLYPDARKQLNALNRVFDERLANIRLTNARMVANMAARGRIKTYRKTTIDWLVHEGGAGTTWTDLETSKTDDSQGKTAPAQLRIAAGSSAYRLSHKMSLSKVDMQEAAQVSVGELTNLLGESVDQAILDIFRRLNKSIWNGDGSAAHGGLIGLNQVASGTPYAGVSTTFSKEWAPVTFGNTTYPLTYTAAANGNVYAITLNGATASYTANGTDTLTTIKTALIDVFRSNEDTSRQGAIADDGNSLVVFDPLYTTVTGSTALTLGTATTPKRAFDRDLMLRLGVAAEYRETSYDMVATTPIINASYSKVFDSIAGAAAINTDLMDGIAKRAELGYGGTSYNGVPIMQDQDAPAGKLWQIDSSQVDLFCFELANADRTGGNQDINDHVVNSSSGLPLHIAAVPAASPALVTFEIFVIPQLRVRSRKALQVISDLRSSL